MLTDPTRRESSQHGPTSSSYWTRRLIILLTILAAIAVIWVALWGASHIISSLLIFIVAALIAYAIYPIVGLFQRVMPRPLAIVLVYVIVLGLLGLLLYFIIKTMIVQLSTLAQNVVVLLTPTNGQDSPLVKILLSIGITRPQIENVAQQLSNQLTSVAGTVAGGILPILSGVASSLINMLLTLVISIYLLVDGARAIRWLRTRTPLPQQGRVNTFISVLQHVVGGYIRGQFTLSLIIGCIVGVGTAALGLSSYAVLLGVLSFVTEFIPVLGTIICGVVAVLLALTQGWLTAVLILAYFICVHIVEGYVLAPRLVGKAVGLHPVVSLLALTIGGELFGAWGAIFASPVAGLVQAFTVALWLNYRRSHTDEFPAEQQTIGNDAKELITSPSPVSDIAARRE